VNDQKIWDVVIVGGGPAGLTAAINLARARRTVLVLDSNRPRNSATFHAHGFLSRDGISPLELRRLGREELEAYPQASFERTVVSRVEPVETSRVPRVEPVETSPARFRINVTIHTRTLLIATGLRERQPAVPSLRTWYGTNIHSCFECDGYEYSDRPIGLLGESDDLAQRAMLLSQWSRDLVVFTNGVGVVSDADEARLGGRGIRVDRRVVQDVAGDRNGLTGVVLTDGGVVPLVGLFVRPHYEPALEYVSGLDLALDDDGLVVIDSDGRTSVRGVYAVGDITPPGPQQLIVAAGHGAHVAASLNRDLLG